MRMVKLNKTWLPALVMLCLSFPAPLAWAQSFPNRTVHIIVGISPGGGVDTTARVLAQQLSKLWGQPVVVENRLGAAGAVATEFVAKAEPDVTRCSLYQIISPLLRLFVRTCLTTC